MDTLLSIFAIGAAPVCLGLLGMLIARKADPKMKACMRFLVAGTLYIALSRVAQIPWLSSSGVASFAVWMTIALTMGAGLALIRELMRAKPTDG